MAYSRLIVIADCVPDGMDRPNLDELEFSGAAPGAYADVTQIRLLNGVSSMSGELIQPFSAVCRP